MYSDTRHICCLILDAGPPCCRSMPLSPRSDDCEFFFVFNHFDFICCSAGNCRDRLGSCQFISLRCIDACVVCVCAKQSDRIKCGRMAKCAKFN